MVGLIGRRRGNTVVGDDDAMSYAAASVASPPMPSRDLMHELDAPMDLHDRRK